MNIVTMPSVSFAKRVYPVEHDDVLLLNTNTGIVKNLKFREVRETAKKHYICGLYNNGKYISDYYFHSCLEGRLLCMQVKSVYTGDDCYVTYDKKYVMHLTRDDEDILAVSDGNWKNVATFRLKESFLRIMYFSFVWMQRFNNMYAVTFSISYADADYAPDIQHNSKAELKMLFDENFSIMGVFGFNAETGVKDIFVEDKYVLNNGLLSRLSIAYP